MKALLASIGVLGALALVVPAAAQSMDRLACYKVKDSARGRFTMVVTNAGVTQNCTAKLPARMACIESSASGVSPTPPGGGPSSTDAGNFLCYTVKCARPSPPAFAMADDLGGSRNVDLRKAQIICTEASRGRAVAGPSPATTTTPRRAAVSLRRLEPEMRGVVRKRWALRTDRGERRVRVPDDVVRQRGSARVRRVLLGPERGLRLHAERLQLHRDPVTVTDGRPAG
jgi:hypothetical protein